MATHYGTVDGFFEYCDTRGYPVGDASPSPSDEITQALVRGSDFIDTQYQARYPGTRAQGRSQERGWPRINATDAEGNAIPDDEVPIEVVHATYEAAFREYVTPNSLLPDYDAVGRVTREQVGPLSVSYADPVGPADIIPVIAIIDGIMAPLLGTMPSMLFGEVTT